jgi:hypothetical protein
MSQAVDSQRTSCTGQHAKWPMADAADHVQQLRCLPHPTRKRPILQHALSASLFGCVSQRGAVGLREPARKDRNQPNTVRLESGGLAFGTCYAVQHWLVFGLLHAACWHQA